MEPALGEVLKRRILTGLDIVVDPENSHKITTFYHNYVISCIDCKDPELKGDVALVDERDMGQRVLVVPVSQVDADHMPLEDWLITPEAMKERLRVAAVRFQEMEEKRQAALNIGNLILAYGLVTAMQNDLSKSHITEFERNLIQKKGDSDVKALLEFWDFWSQNIGRKRDEVVHGFDVFPPYKATAEQPTVTISVGNDPVFEQDYMVEKVELDFNFRSVKCHFATLIPHPKEMDNAEGTVLIDLKEDALFRQICIMTQKKFESQLIQAFLTQSPAVKLHLKLTDFAEVIGLRGGYGPVQLNLFFQSKYTTKEGDLKSGISWIFYDYRRITSFLDRVGPAKELAFSSHLLDRLIDPKKVEEIRRTTELANQLDVEVSCIKEQLSNLTQKIGYSSEVIQSDHNHRIWITAASLVCKKGTYEAISTADHWAYTVFQPMLQELRQEKGRLQQYVNALTKNLPKKIRGGRSGF